MSLQASATVWILSSSSRLGSPASAWDRRRWWNIVIWDWAVEPVDRMMYCNEIFYTTLIQTWYLSDQVSKAQKMLQSNFLSRCWLSFGNNLAPNEARQARRRLSGADCGSDHSWQASLDNCNLISSHSTTQAPANNSSAPILLQPTIITIIIITIIIIIIIDWWSKTNPLAGSSGAGQSRQSQDWEVIGHDFPISVWASVPGITTHNRQSPSDNWGHRSMRYFPAWRQHCPLMISHC